MIRASVLTDGTSDRSLLPIIEWTVREAGVIADIDLQWADTRGVRPQMPGLAGRIVEAVRLYPCELLFIHRDAENEPREARITEIQAAIQVSQAGVPHIGVITVRMLEAWLLISESAIRRAASNPNGKNVLQLPALRQIEAIADPKERLFQLLRDASGRTGRRLQRFEAASARARITEYIDDFAPLRTLNSFRVFEEDLRNHVRVARLLERRD